MNETEAIISPTNTLEIKSVAKETCRAIPERNTDYKRISHKFIPIPTSDAYVKFRDQACLWCAVKNNQNKLFIHQQLNLRFYCPNCLMAVCNECVTSQCQGKFYNKKGIRHLSPCVRFGYGIDEISNEYLCNYFNMWQTEEQYVKMRLTNDPFRYLTVQEYTRTDQSPQVPGLVIQIVEYLQNFPLQYKNGCLESPGLYTKECLQDRVQSLIKRLTKPNFDYYSPVTLYAHPAFASSNRVEGKESIDYFSPDEIANALVMFFWKTCQSDPLFDTNMITSCVKIYNTNDDTAYKNDVHLKFEIVRRMTENIMAYCHNNGRFVHIDTVSYLLAHFIRVAEVENNVNAVKLSNVIWKVFCPPPLELADEQVANWVVKNKPIFQKIFQLFLESKPVLERFASIKPPPNFVKQCAVTEFRV